jgi:hypothetical protein
MKKLLLFMALPFAVIADVVSEAVDLDNYSRDTFSNTKETFKELIKKENK